MSHYLARKHFGYYMGLAENASDQSVATRLQVGACVVTPEGITSLGWNGTPSGCDNCCEVQDESGCLVTKPEVIHAEHNAIKKMIRSGLSIEGSILFVTHAPCIKCALLLVDIGLSGVVYLNEYKNQDGINLLRKCNVLVEKMES